MVNGGGFIVAGVVGDEPGSGLGGEVEAAKGRVGVFEPRMPSTLIDAVEMLE